MWGLIQIVEYVHTSINQSLIIDKIKWTYLNIHNTYSLCPHFLTYLCFQMPNDIQFSKVANSQKSFKFLSYLKNLKNLQIRILRGFSSFNDSFL